MKVFIYSDGGIDKMLGKGQLTPMYGGVHIKELQNDGTIIKSESYPYKFGLGTSNQAEFLAFIHGVQLFKQQYPLNTPVCFFADSKLLVEIINGNWQCKEPTLQVLYTKAMEALESCTYRMQWVPRERNKEADKMSRKLRK